MTGQPAVAPIRIVAGYEAAADTAARAELCLQEMDRLGAFDRSIICVASPTGVGYVSYVFAETLEYLTGGDCAIVMPQYALVPSALALADTGDGAQLQRLVLEGIRERVSKMPPDRRPRVVQFGESLGAQVALDIAYPAGTGVSSTTWVWDAGLYLGVPFRTMTWNTWIQHRDEFDPAASMLAVSDPRLLADLDGERRERVRHLMVVHHDDPVNKFGYRLVVRPPWWMGRPDTRPPKVPREVLWRPITTFVLTLIDLKNGMNFRPGTFERRGTTTASTPSTAWWRPSGWRVPTNCAMPSGGAAQAGGRLGQATAGGTQVRRRSRLGQLHAAALGRQCRHPGWASRRVAGVAAGLGADRQRADGSSRRGSRSQRCQRRAADPAAARVRRSTIAARSGPSWGRRRRGCRSRSRQRCAGRCTASGRRRRRRWVLRGGATRSAS